MVRRRSRLRPARRARDLRRIGRRHGRSLLEEEIARVLAIDLESVLLACKHALPALRRTPAARSCTSPPSMGSAHRNSCSRRRRAASSASPQHGRGARPRADSRHCVSPGDRDTLTEEWLAIPGARGGASWHPSAARAREVAAVICFWPPEASFVTGRSCRSMAATRPPGGVVTLRSPRPRLRRTSPKSSPSTWGQSARVGLGFASCP